MKEAVTMIIDTLIQEEFHGVFQKLLERYKYIAVCEDYFEGSTINKRARTKKSGHLFNDPHIYIYIYIYIERERERGIDNKFRSEVNTIAFRFSWTIIRAVRDNISDVKLNGQVFLVILIFPRFLYFLLLSLHRWFNMINIIPHSPDDGSIEPKRYRVDFASQ